MAYDLSEEEQKLRDFGASILPPWATKTLEFDESLKAQAAIWNRIRRQFDFQWDQSYIGRAEGTAGGGPDFLAQLARDLGTDRMDGEGQAALRTRLRGVDLAVTRPQLLAAINAILDDAGVGADAAAVELMRDRAHFGTYAAQTGTGGSFTRVSAILWAFTPTVPFQQPVIQGFAGSGSWGDPRLVLATCEQADNEGTFVVTGLQDNALVYSNPDGASNPGDATVGWSILKYGVDGFPVDGFTRAFFGRGYRMGRRGIRIILPYGTPPGVADVIREKIRQRKAFGFRAVVEVRANP